MKTRNFIMTFVAAAALLFVGCAKDFSLEKTQWNYSNTMDMTEMLLEDDEDGTIAQIIELMGGQFLVTMNVDLDFTTETAGSMTVSGNIQNVDKLPEMIRPIFEQMMEGMTETSSFTYTFDGENGTLTGTGGDTMNISYNKNDKTLTLTSTDPEVNQAMEEELGSSTLVFKQK